MEERLPPLYRHCIMIYKPYLSYLDPLPNSVLPELFSWVDINTHTDNLEGLSTFLSLIKDAYSSLKGEMETISLPPAQEVSSTGEPAERKLGKALRIRKRIKAPRQILLAGHMDTVYPTSSPFQKAKQKNTEIATGPGITDMKGGLLILLCALQAFEQSPFAETVGWEVLITPDEEIGSPGSQYLFKEAATRCDYGLLFEPSLPNGKIAAARKGSLNFALTAQGKAAHAGRSFAEGESAIISLAHCLTDLHALNDKETTVNAGLISGGVGMNVVPERATCHCNARVLTQKQLESFQQKLQKLLKRHPAISLQPISERPPKPLSDPCEKLLDALTETAQQLNLDLPIQTEPTGGVCDGNTLAFHGLPTIDSLGVAGGKIHTEEEFLLIDSIRERATLLALFLMRLGTGEIL